MNAEYKRIKKIIDDYFRLVRKLMTGEGTVPEHVLKRLKLQGKRIQGLIPRAAKYGASLFPGGSQKTVERDLKAQIGAAQTRVDLAIDHLKTKTLQDAQSALQNALVAAAGAAAGAGVFALVAGALRRRRQETASDWSRTAKTEMHNAKEAGASSSIMAYPDGDQTLVYKVCQSTACSRCVEAYQNPDGSPRIFTIGELRRNGTNAGRKPGEWLPVLGCMHPHCQCTLQVVTAQPGQKP